MTDVERATALLAAGDFACVLCRGAQTLTSRERGVAALVHWLSAGVDLRGFSAADRIAGRAAALLYASAGVHAVHALLASEGAAAVFAERGIEFHADRTVRLILDATRTASCPMEAVVADLDEPDAALPALVAALAGRGHGADSAD